MNKKIIIGIVILVIIGGAWYVSRSKVTNNQTKNQKELSQKVIDETKDDIKKVVAEVKKGDISSSDVEQKMIDAITNSKTLKNQFEKQKVLAPVYVELMEKNKACIEAANNKNEALECAKKGDAMAEKIGLYTAGDDYSDVIKEIGEWDAATKSKMLKEVNDGLNERKSNLKCFEENDTIQGVMVCNSKH